jgi:hypothetical protein
MAGVNDIVCVPLIGISSRVFSSFPIRVIPLFQIFVDMLFYPVDIKLQLFDALLFSLLSFKSYDQLCNTVILQHYSTRSFAIVLKRTLDL